MKSYQTIFYSVTLLAFTLVIGCGPPQPATPPADPAPTTDGQDGATDMAADADNSEVAQTLAKLPADQQAAAAKQKICPVSGQLLGSMGVPLPVDVEGKTVFICCEGCRSPLLADPEKYLPKLPTE